MSVPHRSDLTGDEKDALRCIAHGMTTGMAAESLEISSRTLKLRLQSAKEKLAAKNTTHTVAIALRAGLID